MVNEVVWTNRDLNNLDDSASYIFTDLGKEALEKFRKKLNLILKLVAAQPFVGSKTKTDKYLRKTQFRKL